MLCEVILVSRVVDASRARRRAKVAKPMRLTAAVLARSEPKRVARVASSASALSDAGESAVSVTALHVGERRASGKGARTETDGQTESS